MSGKVQQEEEDRDGRGRTPPVSLGRRVYRGKEAISATLREPLQQRRCYKDHVEPKRWVEGGAD